MKRRPLFVLLLVAALAFGIVLAVVRVVLPAPAPPDVAPRPPATAALTQHLLFVVVDGLRYDVATDPVRMPLFAHAMRERTSGEMWAGRVSMTTSAVLEFGTGQPGRLEQIVTNMNPALVAFNSWIENAQRAGLRVAVVGDPSWVEMYGPWLAEHRVDPKGVAIDVDFNPQTFRNVRVLAARHPNVLIAHFVTPDHQGHAYGIPSWRYAKSIHAFDGDLAGMLAELGSDWTVIVTSDHGAADSGTHGADVPVQRRVPIYAYGPGIAPGVHLRAKLDQADVAGTVAALLGVAAPVHGRGHVLAGWLDLPPAGRAKVACNDTERALAYGKAALGDDAMQRAAQSLAPCRTGAAPGAQIAAARATATRVSASVAEATGLGSRVAWLAASLVTLAAVAIAFLVLGRGVSPSLPAVLAVAAIAIALLYFVERLPGDWPNVVRGVLFGGANVGVLLILLWPGRAADWLERHSTLAPALVPGLLVVSYPTNVQPESYVAVVVCVLLFVLAGAVEPGMPSLVRGATRRLTLPRFAATLGLVVLLFPAGTRSDQVYPRWIYNHPLLLVAAGCVALTLFIAAHGRERTISRGTLTTLIVVAVASLLLRRVAPPLVGRACIVAGASFSVIAALRGRSTLAVIAGVIAYVWVSRDFEIVPLLATVAIAESVGAALAVSRSEPASPVVRTQVLLLACLVFGLVFVQRMGIQGAIDFGSMDWGVAGFGDPHVPEWLVGTALGYKYVLAEVLVMGALAARLDRGTSMQLLPALVVVYVARSVMLLLMLMFCGRSFWTALRVLSDMPFGLTAAVAAVLVWIGASYSASSSSSARSSSS